MKCEFPNCSYKASYTFSLLPLCESHYETIWNETRKFYRTRSGKAESTKRPLYMKIVDKIPWSKRNLKQGEWEYVHRN